MSKASDSGLDPEVLHRSALVKRLEIQGIRVIDLVVLVLRGFFLRLAKTLCELVVYSH
jgi:hypothetical protein